MSEQMEFIENLAKDTLTSINVFDAHGRREINLTEAVWLAGDMIGRALCLLGNDNAATEMGAIEAHGVAIKEAADRIADSISDLADAIREMEIGK